MERRTSFASPLIRTSANSVAPARYTKSKQRVLDRLCVASAVALCLALVPAAMAVEIAYGGNLECADTPKLYIPSFSVPVSAVRDGDRLTVSRPVYKPGTFEDVTRSSGAATIQGGGVVVEMATPAGGVTGRFEGIVSDAEIVLKGVERIKIPDRGEGERACSATLKRR